MTIFCSYSLYGEIYVGFFDSWDAYHAATFNPDIEDLVIKVLKHPRTHRRARK